MKNLAILLPFLTLMGCGGFLYQPDSYWYSDPKQHGLAYEEFKIKGRDGFELTGWHFKTPKPAKDKALVLFLHGNAQNITSHWMNFAWLPPRGHDFMILDYRGYGVSEGKPSQKGLHHDVLDFLQFGWEHFKKGGYSRLVVYGQSMGGAFLLRALPDFEHRQDVALTVIDSSFLSFAGIARDKMKLSWVTYLLSPLAPILMPDEYAPWKTMHRYDRPTLVVHGDADFIIPIKFGEEIYSELKLPEGQKDFWRVPGGRHIDVYYSKEGKRFQDALVKLLEGRESLGASAP